MRSRVAVSLFASISVMAMLGCQARAPEPQTLHFLIESSPTNLDLRQGTDAQSERIGALIYDSLARKDDHFSLQPWLATHWERPDALTWVFTLRSDVQFHDGKPLTSADVAWSMRSMINGTLVTAKGGALASVASIDTPSPTEVVVHLKQPDNALLFNLSDGLFGVVEDGASKKESTRPVGSGPFRFVSEIQDKEVVLERNPTYWAGAPHIARVLFEVVPDTITAALEMKKGSADIESNVLTLDMVHALQDAPHLAVESSPGAIVMYATFNVEDPILRDVRVRQAVACALDKPALIAALWRGQAQPAETLLPANHWAAASDAELPQYAHNVARATQLLDAAGFKPDARGIRLHFTLKTSTDETTRLLAQAMQDELRTVGIALEIRSSEFGTFYADITRGAFQMYMLRWIGSNEDTDIFRYAYSSTSFPPKGGNRGRYSNVELDALLTQATAQTSEVVGRPIYLHTQQILATDLPSIPLWYPNNVVVHTKQLTGITLDPGGTFAFLRTADLHR